MNVLVIGSGGVSTRLRSKPHKTLPTVFVAPGNAGTEPKLENVSIAVENIDALIDFAQQKQVELTIVGPEALLVLGVVDRFREAGSAILVLPKRQRS